MTLNITEVFTPNDFPKYSYVSRINEMLEQSLGDALEIPKTVISISGPSKSGKTVLIEKVVGPDRLITINGAEIYSVSDLWNRVLDWMGVPAAVSRTRTNTLSGEASVHAEGKVGIPLIGGATGVGFQGGFSSAGGETKQESRGGISQVEKEIGGSDFVVFVDDFHYIPKDIQSEIARQIKAAAGKGIKICLAAVPHRADDAVRSNSELRGRTAGIDVGFWSQEELAQIAIVGFEALGYKISNKYAQTFALEACKSPQIMQQICLQACYVTGIRRDRDKDAPLNLNELVFSPEQVREALERAAVQTDYTSLVRDMHAGPKTRGTERKIFSFKDGSTGDVYRAILLALAADPPASDISYSEFSLRVENVCDGEMPGMGSVITSARQISILARKSHPDERIIEWEDNAAGGILSIVDPYLQFYLRSSSKLVTLGRDD